MDTKKSFIKPLTGKKVLLMVLGFFAIIIASNTYMITSSITSFRGEDTKKSYLQGLHYNDTLGQRAAQEASGWTASLNYDAGQINLQIFDKNKSPVSALPLTGKLRHPTDTAKDVFLEFKAQGDGVYTAQIPQIGIGKRILITRTQTDEGFDFETRNELWLQ